jgi:hypothetical protein
MSRSSLRSNTIPRAGRACTRARSFPDHQIARILLRPSPLHRRRRARVVRCDVRRHHVECVPALLQARIHGDGLSPARVQLSHQNEQHGLHMILTPAIGSAVREWASSLPQSLTYAAAIRCRASYEMEWTPVSDPPIDRYRSAAYDTPSSTHPEGMIFEPCSLDLPFVATPALQNHAACRRLKNVMSAAARSSANVGKSCGYRPVAVLSVRPVPNEMTSACSTALKSTYRSAACVKPLTEEFLHKLTR